MWPHVWQIACREEQVALPGDFFEYTIGTETVVIVRAGDGALHAFYNTCLHRGRRLADGCGSFADGAITLPHITAGVTGSTASSSTYRTGRSSKACPTTSRWRPCASTRGAVSSSSISTRRRSRCSTSSIRLPELLGAYHLEQMRLRASLSTIIDANWKAVVDAFNEGYHVQGLHRQILPWTDDVSIEYEQFGKHAHYGRLPGARRELRPSPRLQLGPDDYDEGEILANLVGGLGGAFLGEERAAIEALRATGPPPGKTLLEAYQARRMQLLSARGFDVSGLSARADDERRRRVLLPKCRRARSIRAARSSSVSGRSGSIPTARSRTRGCSSGDAPATADERRVKPKFFENWRDRDWGEITEQDYENLGNVQQGMRSAGWAGARLNPRQESNILHMHRVIDTYLAAGNGALRD